LHAGRQRVQGFSIHSLQLRVLAALSVAVHADYALWPLVSRRTNESCSSNCHRQTSTNDAKSFCILELLKRPLVSWLFYFLFLKILIGRRSSAELSFRSLSLRQVHRKWRTCESWLTFQRPILELLRPMLYWLVISGRNFRSVAFVVAAVLRLSL
jgi:hypothetical protein